VRRALRAHGLALAFTALLVLALVGEAFAGHADYNDQAGDAGWPLLTMAQYLSSSSFAADVAENWQSEYLQFTLYILLTVWLVQRGSPESKPFAKAGRESDEDQLLGAHSTPESPRWARVGGWRTRVFSHSLGIVMGLVFVGAWSAQFVAGRASYNADQLRDLQDPLGWGQYLLAPDFWNRTLQNWQSEFLAVGSMVVLSIYLRERGSPESKPVGAAHGTTGEEG
jgi:hypothetical protein